MAEKAKILVVSNYQDTLSARPEAEIFIGLAALGYTIRIMTQSKSHYGNVFKQHGIEVIDFTPKKKISLSAIKLIRREIKEHQIDVAFFYNSKASINGLIAATGLYVKTVLYRGCAGNISFLDPFAYLKYLNPRADKIICNAKSAQLLLQKQFGFKKEKAVTIHKGHNTEWFSEIQKLDLSNFGVPKDAFVIACAANARPVKGIKYLLQAFGKLPSNLPIHLLIIGRGHETADHLEIIKYFPNRSNIHFVGFQHNLLSIIKSSDLFILPSIDQETLTKSVIEAMCLKIPCIITAVPGNSELSQKGSCAYIVPVKDATCIAEGIMTLYHSPEKRDDLRMNAFNNIKNRLSNEQTIKEYANFIDALVG